MRPKHKKKKIEVQDTEQTPLRETPAEEKTVEATSAQPELFTQSEVQEKTADEAPATIEQEFSDLKQRLQRLAADYQNYQKRAQKQIELTAQLAKESLVKNLLPVLDDFDRTVASATAEQNSLTLLQGIQIVHDHLLKVLQGQGMQRLELKQGDSFDPSMHEAILHEESSQAPPDSVLRELAPGYVMNGRVLRPAKVSVVKQPPEPQTIDEKTNDNNNLPGEE